jgi:hypothetical protein
MRKQDGLVEHGVAVNLAASGCGPIGHNGRAREWNEAHPPDESSSVDLYLQRMPEVSLDDRRMTGRRLLGATRFCREHPATRSATRILRGAEGG